MSAMDTSEGETPVLRAAPAPQRPKLQLKAKPGAPRLGMQGGAFASRLKLDASMDKSWNLSDNGTFSKDGFKINRDGLEAPDEQKMGTSMSPRTFFHVSPEDIYDMGILGKGAGGFVKKCLHTPTLQIIALKSVDVFDKSKRQQLVHELKSLNGCENPYTVTFLGAYYDSGSTKLALEYLNRGSLQDVIDRHGPLKEEVLASVAKQALLGLKHLHSLHKVHRDIKPANMLVDVNGNVKISDFGILAELANTQAKCTTFVGTAVYMSPERIDSENYSYPSDIWSLGMSLVTCALGKLAFEVNSGFFGLRSTIIEKQSPQLPASFSPLCRSFISSCLQKKPTRRAKINDLLGHPFVSKVDPQARVDWPFPNQGGDQEQKDLEVILGVMRDKLYPHGKADYKGSLFDFARFQRLGAQLGFSPQDIQQKFEQMLEDDDEDEDYS